MYFSSLSRYPVPLRPKYSPQHPVLKQFYSSLHFHDVDCGNFISTWCDSYVATQMKCALFWDFTQWRIIVYYRRFGTTFWSILESHTLKELGLLDPWRWTDNFSGSMGINYHSALTNIPKDSRPQVYLYFKDIWSSHTLLEGQCIASQIKHPPFSWIPRTTFNFPFVAVKTNVFPKQTVPYWANVLRTPYFQRICQNSATRIQDVGISNFIVRLNVEKRIAVSSCHFQRSLPCASQIQ